MRGKPAISCPNFSCIRITPAGAGKTNTVAVTRTVKRDHPRRCGENATLPAAVLSPQGSPPQVRGKLVRKNHRHLQERITPAGAGKTSLPHSCGITALDHPRRCGENQDFPFLYLMDLGSPPQVRGKLTVNGPPSNGRRITPAGAGKTIA